jgi:DNA-binding transcriptional MerR regulator
VAQTHYKISEVSALTGLSADTLRYYERIGLLHNVPRTAGGARRYTEQNLVSLRFVQRAQKMNFSLAEIGQLAEMREAPAQACQEVEEIARIKLQEIARHIHELRLLQDELQTLVSQCTASDSEGCPVLEGLEKTSIPT